MKKVIIAEPVLRTVEKSNTLFGRGGIAVFPAQTSEAILTLHRSNKADLIITEFALPVMDGAQLCSVIRRNPALKEVSLIMVCDAGGPLRAQCLEAGANTVMTKPVDPFELFTHLAELLVIPERQDMRAFLHVSVACCEKKRPFRACPAASAYPACCWRPTVSFKRVSGWPAPSTSAAASSPPIARLSGLKNHRPGDFNMG